MHGLNASFRKDPVQFLHECEICESFKLQDYVKVTPAGVYDFDLVPHAFYGTKYTLVSLASENKNAGDREKPITAYWLPWRRNKVEQIELGNQAGYFFTSRLAGCQLRVVPPAGRGTRTKVLHIAGNTSTAWRSEEAKKTLKLSEWHRSRAFSSTQLIPTGYKEVTEEDEKEGEQEVNVVGFKGRFTWEFWAQQIDRAINNKIRRVWKIH